MTITRILLEESAGERRAAAFCAERPVSLFHESALLSPRLHLGQVLEARLTSRDPGSGAFLEGPGGESLFLKASPRREISLGTMLRVAVLAEARSGKLARVRMVTRSDEACPSALDAWRLSLPGGTEASVEPDPLGEVEAAFDEALSPVAALPGGGAICIERTRALTAIDIDSAGRRAGPRETPEINLEAAREAARHLSLRSLGGLVVLDCLSPVGRNDGTQVKTAFLKAFRGISTRKAEALAPSPFGLLECALAWGSRPVDEVYLTPNGLASPYAIAVQGLRRLEREARADRGGQFVLALPGEAWSLVVPAREALMSMLDARYGARLQLRQSERNQTELTTR